MSCHPVLWALLWCSSVLHVCAPRDVEVDHPGKGQVTTNYMYQDRSVGRTNSIVPNDPRKDCGLDTTMPSIVASDKLCTDSGVCETANIIHRL